MSEKTEGSSSRDKQGHCILYTEDHVYAFLEQETRERWMPQSPYFCMESPIEYGNWYLPVRADTKYNCCLSFIKQTFHTLTTECGELMVKEPEGQDHQHNIVNPHSDTLNGSQFQVLKVLTAVHQYRR